KWDAFLGVLGLRFGNHPVTAIFQNPIRRILRVLIAVAGTALAAGISSTPARADGPRTDIHRDNISASLSVTVTEAVVSYRFFGEVNPQVSEILGTISGQPLQEPTLSQYPGFGAKAAILVMLDMTDVSRQPQIIRDKLDA